MATGSPAAKCAAATDTARDAQSAADASTGQPGILPCHLLFSITISLYCIVRGNYDGLVVLTAVTRESLPNQPIVVSRKSILSRKQEEKLADHELFALSLESVLSTHFMYGDVEYAVRLKQ